MNPINLMSNRLKLRFNKIIIFLAIILVTFNGMIPASLPVQAVEKTGVEALEQPNVSKDVDGEENKEIQKKKDYHYNVNVVLPKNISGYETVTILDALDKRLAVQKTAVLINGEVDDRFQVEVVDSQIVSLELTQEQLKGLAGNDIKLQITTQVKEDTIFGKKIENIAEIVINDDVVIETNPAVVTPIDLEEKDQAEPFTSKEKEDGKDKKSNDASPVKESDDQDVKENDDSAAAEKSNVSLSQVQTSAAFEINDTDSYGNTWETPSIIYQFDGNNPSATPKASLTVRGVAADKLLNGLALSKYNNRFYAATGSELYLIDSEGASLKVTNLLGPTGNGVMSEDGTKYYYSYGQGGKVFFASFDLILRQHDSIEVKGLASNVSSLGGDLLVDADGLVWFTQGNRLIQFDPTDGNVILNTELPTDDPEAAGRGLSFLPDGRMLLAGGLTNDSAPKLFVYDPQLHEITNLGSMTKGPVIVDLASVITPSFKPPVPGELKIIKEDEEDGTRLEGATFELKDVDDNKVGKLVTNENGEAVLQDLESGNYNLVETIAPEGYELNNEAIEVTIENDKPTVISIKNTKMEEPVDPPDACAAPVALINGSFEEPLFSPDDPRLTKQRGWFDAPQGAVPGWETTDRSGLFEIMNKSLGDEIPPGDPYESLKVTPAHGQQFAELNSREAAQLYQDVDTTPGQTIYWRLAHKGRVGQDTMALKIDSATVDPKNLKTIETMTSGKDTWQYFSGSYVVPAGQTKTRFGFEAISSANGSNAAGNYLDDIFLGTEPCVTAEKTVSPEGGVFAGDELTYEMTVKNSGGDIAANTVIEDAIPEGTEYVPGSMKILNGPKAGDLTDVEDNDAGHFNDEKVIFKLGDLPNTTTLPDGITVEFKVKALSSHAGKTVENKGQIKFKDLLKDEDKEIETNEVTTPVTYKTPVLESEKTAEIEQKLTGNTDEENPEVGDMLLYTIKTRNTIENSIVEELSISDLIPEGLEYVEGSLKVDAESVTDAEDDDNGHVVDGNIVGLFGDIKDTEWHTLEFLVTVKAGQAGADIKNVATVDGDNIDEPDKPEEEVKVYPRDPVLESEKSAKNLEIGKDKFEVGDILVYTIQTRNKVSDGIVEDLTISDELPEGLEYVVGSLEVDGESVTDAEDSDNGHFVGGKVTSQFGDITDTDWHTITFHAKVKPGQSEKTIKNIATVDGGNIDEPDKPEEEITVDPKDPALESEKSAQLEEKLAGNKDEDNPEVGDTIRYTIKTRNKIEDSIIENLIISDTIPEGLEYVEGSLEVDGESVTDAEDDDKGYVVDGKISGQFGDIRDTDWHTLEFLVTVKVGQAGTDIKNVATVDGDNIDEPDKPEEEVKIYPRDPVLESDKSAKNLETGKDKFEVGDIIVYTIQTRNKVSDGIVEDLTILDELPEGLEYVAGSLEVDGESVTDAEDSDNGHFVDVKVTAQFGDITDTNWHTLTFHAKVKPGQSEKTIKNVATVDGSNIDEPDKPEEELTVDPKDPDLESEKSSKIEEKLAGNTDVDNPEVGDTIRYTITTKNTIEDSLVENLVIKDTIPEGLTYVPGSLEVDGEKVTDAEDDDAGHIVKGEVTGTFGHVTDTDEHTISFLVTVDKGQSGKDIKNIAEVGGDNTGEPDEPEEEVEIYPREPKLESKKSSKLEEKAAGNKDADHPEVGDAIRYTITTKNTIEDSLVENLVITDTIPKGLTYVPGSLEVDGEKVTDAEDDDAGHVVDGKVTGTFGHVTDINDHTVSFLVTVDKGQAGADITNIATVGGDNIDKPDKPEEEVEIYPRHSVFESEKLAANLEKDKEKFEVGDTIVYTIKARNKVSDSLVKNMSIADTLPEGLEYVEDSLKISHEGKGEFKDGKITVNFGDVTDTEWRTVTFQVKIKSGQSGKEIENIATVDGDNVDESDKPKEKVNVDPKTPKLESEKLAKNAEKDKVNYEVGDTVVYTIKARNTVSDSVVKNLTIMDELPEGLEYVEDSLTVNHEGKGEFKDGKITATFGDVNDTEWRTVTFKAKIKSGQEIKNIATVDGENINEPYKPEETIKVEKEREKEIINEPLKPKEDSKNTTPEKGSKLPKTATDIFNFIMIGLGLLVIGLVVLYFRRKKSV
ncbi:isopeptide-forming domain-containing fimbrial protein [Pseudogracilibacillus sp. SE30717A]